MSKKRMWQDTDAAGRTDAGDGRVERTPWLDRLLQANGHQVDAFPGGQLHRWQHQHAESAPRGVVPSHAARPQGVVIRDGEAVESHFGRRLDMPRHQARGPWSEDRLANGVRMEVGSN